MKNTVIIMSVSVLFLAALAVSRGGTGLLGKGALSGL